MCQRGVHFISVVIYDAAVGGVTPMRTDQVSALFLTHYCTCAVMSQKVHRQAQV